MKTSRKGLSKVEVITITDNLTGEVLDKHIKEIYEQYTIRKSQRKFKMIEQDKTYSLAIYKLKSAIDYKLIIALADFVNRDDDIVSIDIKLKKHLAEGLGYGLKAIEQSILALKKANAITPVGRGKYMINPEVIFIGGTVNIENKQELYDKYREEYLVKETNDD